MLLSVLQFDWSMQFNLTIASFIIYCGLCCEGSRILVAESLKFLRIVNEQTKIVQNIGS